MTSERTRLSTVHIVVVTAVLLVMIIEMIVLVLDGQWMNALILSGIIVVILSPTRLGRPFRIYAPPDFQLLAILFTFAALYLGEVRGFYARLWWWDIALHATSGLLLGILGFLLVQVLNEDDRVDLHMRAGFVALFAFLFAVTVGAVWEIFEFAMDRLFGFNMQKPMLGDPSGLTDTMVDLIVDVAGAMVICGIGWWYMRKRRVSFIERMVERFMERNPRLLRRGRSGGRGRSGRADDGTA